MPHRIFLSFSKVKISKIKKVFQSEETISWLYLGKDFLNKKRIKRDLDSRFVNIDNAKLLDETTKRVRNEYIHWIDEMNRLNGNSLDWWFGSISSKDIYAGNLFQYFCYLEMLKVLAKVEEKLTILAFVESWGLMKAIKQWAYGNNITVVIINGPGERREIVRDYKNLTREWFLFILSTILRFFSAYFSRMRYGKKEIGSDSCIVIDTFLHDSSILPDGTFVDRYFPYLHEYLFRQAKTVYVHPVLYGCGGKYFSIYERLRKSKTRFLLREDFLLFSDYLAAVCYPIRVGLKKIKTCRFLDINVEHLVREEKRKWFMIHALQAVLIYRLFLRLEKSALKPDIVINWYENQPIDKALIAGVRLAFPKTMIIGAQIFIHSPNMLNLFPIISEAEACMAPHLLLETSERQCEMAQSFTTLVPCQSAAALRYSHLFIEQEAGRKDIETKPLLLMLLPFDISEALEILHMMTDAMCLVGNDMSIFIKPHPDCDADELMRAYGQVKWPADFKFFGGDIHELLNKAKVVVSSNSSAMIEAAAMGVPVIFLGRQTVINQNLLADLNMNIVVECFTVEELVAAIRKYCDDYFDKESLKQMGKKVRDIFFMPVNEVTLQPFLSTIETIKRDQCS